MTDTPTVNDVVRRHMVSFAREFLGQESGSVDARKQTAVLACKDVWLDAEIAEQQVRACRERIRTIRDQMEVGRSLNSAIKSEWSASSVGQS